MADRPLVDEDIEQNLDGVTDLRGRTRLVRIPVVGSQVAYRRFFASWSVNNHRGEATTGGMTVRVYEEMKRDRRTETNPAVASRESGWVCVVMAELMGRRRDQRSEGKGCLGPIRPKIFRRWDPSLQGE